MLAEKRFLDVVGKRPKETHKTLPDRVWDLEDGILVQTEKQK